jgi:hypothetical protein
MANNKKMINMKTLILLLLCAMTASQVQAQTKYFTKTGQIIFQSKSALENIEAVNNKVVSVLDIATGQIEFSVLMKGFEFKRALMQEHFNENYVESDKYPKANFKGVIESKEPVSLNADMSATVKVNGSLTIHGVTNPVSTTAVITVKKNVLSASANFIIALADYKITIPSVVSEKINKQVTIAVNIPAYQVFAK